MKWSSAFSALSLATLLAGCGCTARVQVRNDLGVRVPRESLRALKLVANRDDAEIQRIEFTLCSGPIHWAAAVVHYDARSDGKRVIQRCRVFTNPAWPRRGAGVQVHEYRWSLGTPRDEWLPTSDALVETVWHRLQLDSRTQHVILEGGVTYQQAQTVLRSLQKTDASPPYMKGFKIDAVDRIDRAPGSNGGFRIWTGSMKPVSRAIIVEEKDGAFIPVGFCIGSS